MHRTGTNTPDQIRTGVAGSKVLHDWPLHYGGLPCKADGYTSQISFFRKFVLFHFAHEILKSTSGTKKLPFHEGASYHTRCKKKKDQERIGVNTPASCTRPPWEQEGVRLNMVVCSQLSFVGQQYGLWESLPLVGLTRVGRVSGDPIVWKNSAIRLMISGKNLKCTKESITNIVHHFRIQLQYPRGVCQVPVSLPEVYAQVPVPRCVSGAALRV